MRATAVCYSGQRWIRATAVAFRTREDIMPTAKRSTATGKRAAAKKTSAKAPAADAGKQTVAGQASDESEPTASEPLP